MNKEIWKPIKDYEGLYEISNTGLIKRNNKILKNGMMTRGYHKIVLCNGKTKKQFGVHRLVAQHFIPNPYNKPFVNHINCVKTDNNVENLEWVTEKENVKHAKENGLYHKGEEHYRTKLTEKDVIAIRRLGVVRTQTELAKCFNVQPSTIGKIVRRERWKHI